MNAEPTTQVDALWHGTGGQQRLIADGWVGEHPEDGDVVAHLLLHPTGHGASAQMRTLAEALTLTRADTTAPITHVPFDTASAWIDPQSVLHLHGPNTQLMQRPIDGAWWSAATTRRYLVLSVGMDPLHWRTGDWAALDRYLDRRHRYHLGLVEVSTPPPHTTN